MTEPRKRPRPGLLPTLLAAVACFLVIFEFLAFQLRSGNDPALGASPATPAAAAVRPTVIDRKLIKRRIVHLPARPQTASAGSTAAPAVVSSPPATTAPAAPAAPAPAPAPAPAAPVTSSS